MGQIRNLEFAEGTTVTAPTDLTAGGGSGSGEINTVTNGNGATALDAGATNDINDWVDSGTGTTSSATSTAAEIPLSPIQETAIKILNDGSSTGYTRVRIDLPVSLRSRKLKITWEQLVSTSPAYASGDFKVEVYSYSDAFVSGETRLSLPTDSSAVSAIPAQTGKYTTTFDATTRQYYEIRIVRAAGTTNSFIALNEVIVGPGIQPQGAVVGAFQSYTPATTQGFGTIASSTLVWRQVGEAVHVTGRFTTGTVTASQARLGLPNAYTASNGADTIVGRWWINNNSATTRKSGTLWATNDEAYVHFGSDDYTTAVAPGANINGDTVATTGVVLYVEFQTAVGNLVGSGTLNVAQNDVLFASNGGAAGVATIDTADYKYGPAGSLIGNITAPIERRVIFPNFQTGDLMILEIWSGNANDPWMEAAGSTMGGFDITYKYQNGEYYGIGIQNTAVANTARVSFGRYAWASGGYGTAGTTWLTSGLGVAYWRVRLAKGGQAVGFGLADTAGNAGLVNPYSSSGAGVVYSGTYTPTITNGANVAASTAYLLTYTRVGRNVIISGRMDIDPTAAAATSTVFTFNPPSGLPLSATAQSLGGVGAHSNQDTLQFSKVGTAIEGNFNSSATANGSVFFTLQYYMD